MELQQKANRLEQMKSTMEVLGEQKQMLDNYLDEHDRAKKTMKQYQKKDEGTEIMVPIGADSYVHSKISNSEEVLIGIGSDLSAEQKIEKALDVIERKKEKIKESKEELEEKIDELNEDTQALQQEIREEYQKLQQQQQQQAQGGGQVFDK